METELISGEISYLKPRRAKWKEFVEAAVGVAGLVLFGAIMYAIAVLLFR